MDQKVIDFNKSQQTKELPKLSVGDIVRVHKKIKEGDKERVQIFQGLIINIKGRQSSSPTITVRREAQKIGVEITVPIYMPSIEKIEILRHNKVRRSKIYYMRELSGKAAKMKAIDLTEEEKTLMEEMNKKPSKKEKVEKK